jgi:Gram-negative bacterial TonB protein C-terminal
VRVVASFIVGAATFFLAASCTPQSPDRPAIYNHVAGSLTEIDSIIHQRFGLAYNVIDVTSEAGFVPPKGIVGFGVPTPPAYVDSRCVAGHVIVLFAITVDGGVSDPYVAKSTDALLKKAAIQSAMGRKYRPAQLNGKSVPSIAGMQLEFACPSGDKA